MMESLKTAYKAAKRAYEADQTSESLKQEYVAAKKRYKQSKPGTKDVLAPPSTEGGGGNRAGRRLGVHWTPRSGKVAGLRAEVVIESRSWYPTQKLIALRPSNYACACCQNGN